MAAEGSVVEPDDLMVTTGGQQVIDLVCRAFIDPGDVIVAEAPTYPGAVPCFTSFQADVVQIEMDDDGMRIDVLEATLAKLRAEGRRPKFIYTIPNFHNPGGVTMSLERRKALVRIANEQELVVLEDNPYGLLRYEGEALPTLYTLDGGRYVIYAGTFSKILSAGLRLGWAAAPGADPRAPEPRQAGRRPLLVADDPVLRRRLLRAPRLAQVPQRAARDLPPPARRDDDRDGRVPAARDHVDEARAAGSSCGPSCRTTSTRPTCWRGPCASTWPSCPAAPRTSTAAAARSCG